MNYLYDIRLYVYTYICILHANISCKNILHTCRKSKKTTLGNICILNIKCKERERERVQN